MLKYILAWFPLIFMAIANGLFREKILSSRLNELQAHQMSTTTMIVLFAIYVWILFKIWIPTSFNQSIMIGIVWLTLTIIFEFLFGHYVAGHSWDRLLQDYNILKGKVWVLVLIWILIAPYIVYRLQK